MNEVRTQRIIYYDIVSMTAKQDMVDNVARTRHHKDEFEKHHIQAKNELPMNWHTLTVVKHKQLNSNVRSRTPTGTTTKSQQRNQP